ncbi:glycerol-3-phosphate dehydrogenase/oxidase [Phyllobacterium sp. SB3]|uniref:glycerol-3-phosphate dehydrogenase/oxidase n=1 Tax=Phyllobacterium sp. SB3 TaxID=3156073 RepID=UPI0032AEF643
MVGKLQRDSAPLPSLQKIATHYPVIIIGAGINGCGLFRDLCAQGIDCLMLDRSDFCSGASAAPSRLIHGGIKYLETGEFRLVRQSARERNLLLKNAPHYVKPLETVLPVYSWFGGIIPSIKRFLGFNTSMNDRGAAITEIGLFLYDVFGRHFRTMPNHKMHLRKAALKLMPELNPDIVATGIYYEGRVTHAERLGLELVLDALSDNPLSVALNYTSVSRSVGDGIELFDEITGDTVQVSADLVINAGGAWIDTVNAKLGIETRHMGGNKGSHLIVRNDRLLQALGGRMVYFGSADGRVNLLYPFMGNVLVGSTDIPIDHPDEAFCSDEERDYLSKITQEVFPAIKIQPEDIVMTYCGVRPLPRSEGIDRGLVSRDHSIAKDTLPGSRVPVFSLIGGKWTTFRGFSEEVANLVLGELDRRRSVSTEYLPIGGGRDFPINDAAMVELLDKLKFSGNITDQDAGKLVERYGTRALNLLENIGAERDTPLQALPEFGMKELQWICQNELVGRLSDLLFRRTDIALSGQMSMALMKEVAQIMADCLDWSEERTVQEIENTIQTCRANGMILA